MINRDCSLEFKINPANMSRDQKKPRGTYLAQVGSVFSTLGFPTTISRALARVTATLNLWTRKECVRMTLCVCVCIHSVRAWVCVVYLLILDEAKVELFVYLCVIGAASNCRHHDHSPLLTLELLHWTNLKHTHTHTRKTLLLLHVSRYVSMKYIIYLKAVHVLKFKVFPNSV